MVRASHGGPPPRAAAALWSKLLANAFFPSSSPFHSVVHVRVRGGGSLVMKFERWSSCGSRRLISQAFGHRRILLPLCILRHSPASSFAPSHSGVARDDGNRTVSHNSFLNKRFFFPSPGWPCPLTLAETPVPSHCSSYPRQGPNRGADTSQTQPVEGTAHPRAGTRKRDLERR